MKNIIFYIIGITSLIFTQSCNDYLDVKPKTFFTRETYYSKPEHAQQAVSACYDLLRRPYRLVGTYGEASFMMLEFATGMCNTSIAQASYNIEFRETKASANNIYAWDWWQSYYEGIENCNIALENLPGIPGLSESQLSHFMGEAYFLRAYYYFILVQIFGDIPLQDKSTVSPEDVNVHRSPVADIYNLIVSDLIAAEKTSLPNTSNSGKITMGAVKSLLAKVYLTMAGYPLQNTEMYAQAAAKAGEVVNSGWYNLFPDIDDLRNRNNRNTVEHIFQTQFAAGIAEIYIHPWLLPRYSGISGYSDEYGCIYPDSSFIRTFDRADKRIQEKGWFYTEYPKWNNPSEIVTFEAHIYKYFDDNAMGTYQGSQNYPNLRYADILLVYAEAQNEAEGSPNALALQCYNAVRNRAGLSSKTLADFSSQNNFREAVWKERYWELCFENQIWYDMARTRKVFDLVNNRISDFVGYVFPYGNGAFRLTETQLLFPIPLRERQTNKNLTQNSGY